MDDGKMTSNALRPTISFRWDDCCHQQLGGANQIYVILIVYMDGKWITVLAPLLIVRRSECHKSRCSLWLGIQNIRGSQYSTVDQTVPPIRSTESWRIVTKKFS